MANSNVLEGIKCPSCNSEGPFTIVALATFTDVTDDGCTEFEGVEWNQESDITCNSCGQNGDISVFTVYEDEEDETPQGEGIAVPVSSMADLFGGKR
jgi:hypothetical protein